MAEYSNGDEEEPVKLPFADQCLAKHLQREARLASLSAPTKKPAKLSVLPQAANAERLQQASCPRRKPFVPAVVSASAEEQVTSLKAKRNKGIVNEIPFSGLKQ